MRVRLCQSALAAALLALAQTALAQARPLLRSQVTVAGPVVTLADLMSGALPSDQSAAGGLPITAAPDPGTRRGWRRSEVESALRAAGIAPEQFTIPDQIVLSGASNPLTRAEVWTAVSAWLETHPVYPPALDAATRMRFSRIQPQSAHPVIVIDGARWDEVRAALELTCRISGEPKLLPFTVTLPLSVTATSAATLSAMETPHWLVQPGQPVEMRLHTSAYDLNGTAMPLKPGILGDRIPVVNLINQAVLQAEITGKNAVQILAEDPFHDRP